MTRKQLIRLWAFALNTAKTLDRVLPNATEDIPYEDILTDIERRIGYSMSASQRKDVLEQARRMREE